MSADADKSRGLHTFLVRAIRTACGLSERYAVPIATDVLRELKREFGDEKIYIGAPPAAAKRAKILADYDGTAASREAICKQHHISRATFYRLLNGEDVT